MGRQRIPAPVLPQITPDLVPLGEVSRRLELSPKTLKRLHRDHGLPLMRFNGGGGYFAFWSEIERWASTRKG
jgi:hypothetical protein